MLSSMSSLPSPLRDPLVELIAQRVRPVGGPTRIKLPVPIGGRLLGQPTRIKLLDALRAGQATVTELQAATEASQQNVSKHLGMLVDAGLVRRVKDGNRAYFSIADESLFDLCEQVCGSLRPQ